MRCADVLGKALRIQLANLFKEVGNVSLDDIKRNDGLKSNLLTDPYFTLQITSEQSFKVFANPEHICSAILRDFYYGYERISSQWESTCLLANEEKTAWALISAYYCSFFGAIEALRICGNHSLSLTTEEAEAVFTPLGGPYLNKILEKQNFKGVISPDFKEIGYTSTGTKPHQAAWKQMNELVLPFVPRSSSAWSDVLKFSNMCSGKGGWESPSAIRNRWNYRDSSYFGALGSNSKSPFIKIINDDKAASSWIKSKLSVYDESDSAASIAALAKLMHLSIKDSYDFGFMTTITANQ